mmetsp:Transcript_69841/g.164313  ORF Transcript_69841/g.164313 Transcript_69841/m.164313 type:complete len:303 (+) Transcript_69841:873-1781(+)
MSEDGEMPGQDVAVDAETGHGNAVERLVGVGGRGLGDAAKTAPCGRPNRSTAHVDGAVGGNAGPCGGDEHGVALGGEEVADGGGVACVASDEDVRGRALRQRGGDGGAGGQLGLGEVEAPLAQEARGGVAHRLAVDEHVDDRVELGGGVAEDGGGAVGDVGGEDGDGVGAAGHVGAAADLEDRGHAGDGVGDGDGGRDTVALLKGQGGGGDRTPCAVSLDENDADEESVEVHSDLRPSGAVGGTGKVGVAVANVADVQLHHLAWRHSGLGRLSVVPTVGTRSLWRRCGRHRWLRDDDDVGFV